MENIVKNPIEGWTVDQIYNLVRPGLDLIPNLTLNSQIAVRQGYGHRWSEKFAQYLRTETRFIPIEPHPHLTREQIAAIEAQNPCPLCGGTRKEVLVLSRGVTTGIVVKYPYLCDCAIHVKVAFKWNDTRQVPKDFRHVRLTSLAPNSSIKLAKERQAEIIARITANPKGSFFLFGPPGLGKTHIATALYRNAVERWADQWFTLPSKREAVWRTSTSLLLEETTRWDNRGMSDKPVEKPVLIVEDLQRAFADGYDVSLFLDEIDKFAPTEYKLNKLFQLVDIVWSNGGQIVATANKGIKELSAKWGADMAGSILRRVADKRRGGAVFFGMQKSEEQIESPEPTSKPAQEEMQSAPLTLTPTPNWAEDTPPGQSAVAHTSTASASHQTKSSSTNGFIPAPTVSRTPGGVRKNASP